jgi:hypothetical protein
MTPRKKHTDEELQRWLRRNDPAGDGASLSREEVRAIRRSVLAAHATPARRFGVLQVALATAVLAVAAVALWLALRGIGGEVGPVAAPQPPVVIVERAPAPPSPERAIDAVHAPAPAPQVAVTRPRNADLSPRAPAPVSPVVARVAQAAPAQGAERRQIQFTTPGGTKIVWILDPTLSL